MLKLQTMLRENFSLLMDPDKNPLRTLRIAQRYQIMIVLAFMWTTIFSAAVGAWYFYGELVLGHVLVLLGILITRQTFKNSGRNQTTYRDYPRSDGTARYSDVWGG